MNIKEINLNEIAVDELKEFQTTLRLFLKDKKEEIKATEKANKEADKAAKIEAGKAIVAKAGKGGTITVIYHDEEVTGTICKDPTDKTVSIIITEDGEDKVIWRYFYQVVS